MPTVDGHDIHVVTTGEGSPAVMIHCALAQHKVLLPLAEALTYSTSLFDMPGHGGSAPWDGKADYQKLVADAAGACCTVPSHVIGHSFGATAALRLAVEHPGRVTRLTLIEPVYFAAAKGTPEHAAHQKAFRPFVAAMLQGDEAQAAKVFNDLWGEIPWAKLPAKVQADLTRRIHLIVAGGAAIEEDADGITSPERLKALNIPVTLIRGSKTQPVIEAIHNALAGHLRNATDHIVKSAGHMLPITHLAEVAQVIGAGEN